MLYGSDQLSSWIIRFSSMTSSTEKVLLSLINFLSQTPCRQKLCRLVQYFSKYLGSVYSELNEQQPHLRNQLVAKIKKTDTMWASMAMARKVLRFGPSITCLRTFIMNTLQLIKGQNKESTPIFILKTLSALWIAAYFICDHYLWLFRMGIVSNEKARVQFDYYSCLSWYVDCYTGLIKNLLIYLQLTDKEKKEQTLALIVDSVRLLLDIPVAYAFVNPGKVPPKAVGFCGTVTSLIAIYQNWK